MQYTCWCRSNNVPQQTHFPATRPRYNQVRIVPLRRTWNRPPPSASQKICNPEPAPVWRSLFLTFGCRSNNVSRQTRLTSHQPVFTRNLRLSTACILQLILCSFEINKLIFNKWPENVWRPWREARVAVNTGTVVWISYVVPSKASTVAAAQNK